MTELIKLRNYQEAAIDATRRRWSEGVRRPAVVLPTGAGKTIVFAHIVTKMRELGVKSIVLAHRDELIEQAANKLRDEAPDLRIGIWKARQREWRNRDAVVASVASLRSEAARVELARFGARLVIVDECHHATANLYINALRAFGCFEDGGLGTGAAALGVTATLARSDRVALGQVWQEVAYQRSILDMIREGYLVNMRGLRVRIDGLDLSRVKRVAGDFQDRALAEAMHDSLAPKAVARAYREHASDRQGILFAPSVAMAYEFAEAFNAEGISAAGLDGTTPKEERREILARSARGELQMITNCGVLTEGFDAPHLSCVVIARPTSSGPLYVQMVGRGSRLHPGKRDCLVMDVVGVTGRHRLTNMTDLMGADRVEKLPDELREYDEIDLLGFADEVEAKAEGSRWMLPGADGPLVSEIVDLFTSSRRAWLQTRRGVWFLPAGKEKLIFLAPGLEPGAYNVGRCAIREAGGEWLREGVDLEMAMSLGEQHAAGEYGYLSQRSANWRKGVPGSTQVAKALSLGIADTTGMSKGDLSDRISFEVASARLDNAPAVATVSERGYW